jgi:hypothetical protein
MTGISPTGDDEDNTERCPLCKDRECRRHLFACFDESGDDGEFGVGIFDGPLFCVKEIAKLLERIQLAWVRSVRATGKPKPPRWIMKKRSLRHYFDGLGGSGFDVEKYESDDEAVSDLSACTDFHNRLAKELLEEILSSCGDWIRTRREFDALMRSTTYESWWTWRPGEVAQSLTSELQRILLEADNETKPTSKKSTSAAKKAPRMKSPTKRARATVAKKSNVKRGSR